MKTKPQTFDIDNDMEPCKRCGHGYDRHLHYRDGTDCSCGKCDSYVPHMNLWTRVWIWLASKGLVR